MNDTAQVNLQEPSQVDWDNIGKTGYQAPPAPVDANGKVVVFYGKTTPTVETEYQDTDPVTGNPLLTFRLDPITITKGPEGATGYQIRFGRASTRPFTKNIDGVLTPLKGNPNSLGNYLRAAGSVAKPQLNTEYIAAVKQVATKEFPFTADWEARNKETGEVIRGYNAFPDDPQRPGQKKSILKAGDLINILDKKGNLTGQTTTIKSEVIFANLKLKYFQDPKKGTLNQ